MQFHDSARAIARSWFLLLALLSLGAIAGCAGNGPPPSDTDSSFDQIQRTIFNVSCIAGACHSSTGQAESLVLEEGRSYANLVNVLAANPAARAAKLLRVAPGNPDASFLLIKLIGPSSAQQGTRMPQVGALLSPADIARVRAWILAGAPGPSGPVLPASPTATFTATPTGSRPPTAVPTATPSATATP
jgi:hypothetical protein